MTSPRAKIVREAVWWRVVWKADGLVAWRDCERRWMRHASASSLDLQVAHHTAADCGRRSFLNRNVRRRSITRDQLNDPSGSHRRDASTANCRAVLSENRADDSLDVGRIQTGTRIVLHGKFSAPVTLHGVVPGDNLSANCKAWSSEPSSTL